jgi:hypothetical protein
MFCQYLEAAKYPSLLRTPLREHRMIVAPRSTPFGIEVSQHGLSNADETIFLDATVLMSLSVSRFAGENKLGAGEFIFLVNILFSPNLRAVGGWAEQQILL